MCQHIYAETARSGQGWHFVRLCLFYRFVFPSIVDSSQYEVFSEEVKDYDLQYLLPPLSFPFSFSSFLSTFPFGYALVSHPRVRVSCRAMARTYLVVVAKVLQSLCQLQEESAENETEEEPAAAGGEADHKANITKLMTKFMRQLLVLVAHHTRTRTRTQSDEERRSVRMTSTKPPVRRPAPPSRRSRLTWAQPRRSTLWNS